MPWPTPNVLGLPFDAKFGRWGGPQNWLYSPTQLPNLSAWFDALDTQTMLAGDGNIVTDGGTVCLWKDKSGNSGTVCYVSGVAASNSVSSPNKSVTGNQTFTLDVGLDDYTPSGDLTLVSKLSGNDGFAILVLTTGVVRLRVGDGASVTNVDSSTAFTMTDLRRHTIGIAWTDGVGASFTQDGAPVGTPVVAAKTLTNAAVVCTIGTITGRIYRVQVGSVYDFNPAGQTAYKLANGDTLTTGGDVWTLASSGATGARIASERDLFQGTAANRPVLLQYSGTKYAYLNAASTSTFTTPNIAGDSYWRFRARVVMPNTGFTQAIAEKGADGGEFGFGFSGSKIWLEGNVSNDSAGRKRFAATNDFTHWNVPVWLMAIFTEDDGTGNARVSFDYSLDDTNDPDLVTWTEFSSDVTMAAFTQFTASSTASVGKGGITFGNLAGRVLYCDQSKTGDVLAVSFNPSLYTSGTTFTASTGEVWTVNGGAHIVTRTGLYGNGSTTAMQSAKYSAAQPLSTYVFGEQVSWTSGDYIIDGSAANAAAIVQTTSTPQINLNAGSSANANTGFAVKTFGMLRAVFNGASSLLGVNRVAPATGDAGATAANGLTVFASGGLANNGNAFIAGVAQYGAAQDAATSSRLALWGGRRHGFTP